MTRSSDDELVIDEDPAVLIDHEDLEAGTYRVTAARGYHLPRELDQITETNGVIP